MCFHAQAHRRGRQCASILGDFCQAANRLSLIAATIMKSRNRSWNFRSASAVVSTLLVGAGTPAMGQTRSLGIDVSTYQGDISAANWTTLKTSNSRDFAQIR